jgi:hypothetical protein
MRRSQWPSGLRPEVPSLTSTLISGVRTPFEAWISVYSGVVFYCVGKRPCEALIPQIKGPAVYKDLQFQN